MDIFDAQALKDLIAILAPGLLIIWIRQWFVAGPTPSLQERVLSYAGVSTVYYAISIPIFKLLEANYNWPEWALLGSEYLILPFIIGIALSVSASNDWLSKITRKIGLYPKHHTPTAWDYTFNRIRMDAFVIVTLNDGTQIYGHYGEQSFASSCPNERDILIGQVWDYNPKKGWSKPQDRKSILLCGKDIKSIEFIEGSDD